MTTKLLILMLGVACIVGACSGATVGSTQAPDESPTHESITNSTVIPGLTSAFLGFVYPVDSTDLSLGWRTFEEPRIRTYLRDLAACLEGDGFRSVARAFRAAEPTPPAEPWLFPDLAALREDGFHQVEPDVAWTLLGSMDPDAPIADPEHSLIEDLAANPELDVPATPEAATELNSAMWSCVVDHEVGEAFDAVQLLKSQWRLELHRLDDGPAVADAIPGFLACVRSIDPSFADVESVDDWWATQLGQRINLAIDPTVPSDQMEATMRGWGRAYADCVEPVMTAREAERLSALEQVVEDNFARLLEFQRVLTEEP